MKCLDCMLNYDKDFDAIGISFHNDFFYDIGITSYCNQKFFWQTLFPENEDSFYAIGRVKVLYYLNEHGYLKTNKHIHLLGSHWPIEKKIYKKCALAHLKRDCRTNR